jgi:hypothetical protein
VQVDDDILLAVADDYEEAALVFLGGVADEGRNARITIVGQQEGRYRRKGMRCSYIAFLPMLKLRLKSLNQVRWNAAGGKDGFWMRLGGKNVKIISGLSFSQPQTLHGCGACPHPLFVNHSRQNGHCILHSSTPNMSTSPI